LRSSLLRGVSMFVFHDEGLIQTYEDFFDPDLMTDQRLTWRGRPRGSGYLAASPVAGDAASPEAFAATVPRRYRNVGMRAAGPRAGR
jgi:hypothetical protein